MALLLQINLNDIQLTNYPQTGFIEIFISSYLDWPQESKILYFADNEQARTDLPPTINTVVEEPIAIRFEKCIEYMPIEDYRSNDIIKIVLQECKISEENLDEIIDLLWDEVPRECSTMCGYANFTQYDPRNSESDQDACFFKLDSLFDKKIDIGDAGILSVFCSEADIANQQYKKMICYWDCC